MAKNGPLLNLAAGPWPEKFSNRGTILKDALEYNFTNCKHNITQALKL